MKLLAQTTAHAVAKLAQRIGVSELAEQHRDQLRPAAKTFGAPFRIVFFDQRSKLGPGKMLEQLIEQTRDLYDGRSSGPGTIRQRSLWEGFSFAQTEVRAVLDKSDFLRHSRFCERQRNQEQVGWYASKPGSLRFKTHLPDCSIPHY